MSKKLNLSKVVNIIFYIALTIEILIVILETSVYTIQYQSYWFRLTFLLFGIKIFFTKYSLKEWGTIILFGVLGVISYYITGRNEIIRIVVFIAACKEINFHKMMKYTFFTTLMGSVILVILSFFNIGVLSITDDFRPGIVQTRYCFGMGHPNGCHCMFWALLTLLLYVYHEKMKWYHYVILFISNIVLYLFTDSRAGVAICVITLVASFIVNTYPITRNTKTIYILGIITIISCAIISAVLFNGDWYEKYFKKLDEILTYRIFYSVIQDGMDVRDWTLFGLKSHQLYTDMGYVKMVYWYGLIPALIYIAMCCRLVWSSIKTKDFMAALITVVISIYSLFEAHDISVYIARNYILFFFGMYWSKMLCVESENRYYLIDIFRIKSLLKEKS